MDQIIEDLKKHISVRLQKTILKKGRNHGTVSVRIEPFFQIYFDLMFGLLADDKDETWQVVVRKRKAGGRRFTKLTVRDYFAGLDDVFGGSCWRKAPIHIPFPGSENGTLYDGYWQLNSHKPVLITFNHEKHALTILYHVCEYNRHGVYQGCQ